jgi:hypothetical protein
VGDAHRRSAQAERTAGKSVPDIIKTTFEEDVQPSLVRTADTMAKEFDSR